MVYFDPNSRAERVRPTTNTSGTVFRDAVTTPLSEMGQGSIFKPWANSVVGTDGPLIWNPETRGYTYGDSQQFPIITPPGGYPPGGGGGGGGGAKPIDWGAMSSAMAGYRPDSYQWQDSQWKNVVTPQRQANNFYNFDQSQYDKMRQGIQTGLAADLASGRSAYGDARGELQQYQNPFAGRSYTQNPQMSEAMQRMMAANGVQPDQADAAQGVQADRAFGNVLALLGGNADMRQAQQLRALGGDERRFGESLASEGRTMTLGVDMALAKAREQYDRDKWQYGEDIANQNWQANVQAAMYNNQGQNDTSRYNNQGVNSTAQNNTQARNDYYGNNVQQILQLLASGQKPPSEMQMAGMIGVPSGLDPSLAKGV